LAQTDISGDEWDREKAGSGVIIRIVFVKICFGIFKYRNKRASSKKNLKILEMYRYTGTFVS